MKNLEFLSNFAENFRVLSSHGQINPSKFEQNWAKIVDFSLMAYFLSSLNWGEQVCSFSVILESAPPVEQFGRRWTGFVERRD